MIFRGGLGLSLKGFLAHKKPPASLGPPYGLEHGPTVGSWEGAFSYERGIPDLELALRARAELTRVWVRLERFGQDGTNKIK